MLVWKSKKGVSPLIATILLIAFAVALGAVVMQLGAGLGGDDCSADLQLSLKGFPCYDSTSVKLNLKNSGSSDIEGASIWIHGSKEGIKTKNIGETIAKGSSVSLSIDYDFSVYGDVTNIEIIPKFKKDDESISCQGAKIEASDVSNC